MTSVLAATVTNATTTMAAMGLTVTVTSGHRYAFRAILMLEDTSTLGGSGAKFDFDASTAGVTDFRAWASTDLAVFASGTFLTAFATDIESSEAFSQATLILEGSLEPSSTGTFALRFAQLNAVDGNITLFRGSSLTVWEP